MTSGHGARVCQRGFGMSCGNYSAQDLPGKFPWAAFLGRRAPCEWATIQRRVCSRSTIAPGLIARS
jgi:hypothetical protein